MYCFCGCAGIAAKRRKGCSPLLRQSRHIGARGNLPVRRQALGRAHTPVRVYKCALSEFWDRAQLYTGQAGALRPAGGFLRKADDFQHTCDCFQSSQGTLRFPCAGCASYPFVDLPPGNELLFFIGFSTFRHHDYFIIGNRFWIIFQNIADFWRICPAQIAMFFGFV